MQFAYDVMAEIHDSLSHKAVMGTDFLKQNKLGPCLNINHFE